jgi:hypothetical protein
MNRRALVRSVGAVGIAALAGCGSTDDSAAGTPSDTATATPAAATPMIAGQNVSIVRIESGRQQDTAGVDVDGATVTVEGTIWGSDGCTTAELADASYDAAADELAVAVATTEREATAADMCTQAIVEIEYRATVAFENGVPGTVVVTHDHGDGPETVTTDSP